MKKILFVAVICLTLSGCGDEYYEPIDGRYESLGFVSEYGSPDRMVVRGVYPSGDDPYIFMSIAGKEYTGHVNDPDEVYITLAKKYGDTKKQRVVRFSNGAITVEPHGFTVVCDRDIDEEHPAGTPLDDIILMYGWTYKEYIDSRYTHYTDRVQETYGYPIGPTYTVGHSPFLKYLSDIKKEDLVLMNAEFYLFPPRDWPEGEYNLTVTMYADDGLELSATAQYIVE